jgi:hypothetical protein
MLELIWNLGWFAIYISGFFTIFVLPLYLIYNKINEDRKKKLITWYESEKDKE